jgi:hypothetical protein
MKDPITIRLEGTGKMGRCETVARRVLAATILVCIVLDAHSLFRFPVAPGIDGYYYMVQAKALGDSGYLYYPTRTPVVFWIIVGFQKVIPNPVVALKCLWLLIELAFVLASSILIASLTGSFWLACLTAIVLGCSDLHLFMLCEFLKQLTAYLFLVLAILTWLRAKYSNYIRIGATAVLAVLALFAHLSAAAWMISMVFFGAVLRVLREGTPIQRVLAVSGLSILFAMPAILVLTSAPVPSTFHAELTTSATWPFLGIASAERLLAYAAAVVALIFLMLRRQLVASAQYYIGGIISLFTVVITFNPFLLHAHGSLSLAGRLGDVSYVQLAFLLPIALHLLRCTGVEMLIRMIFFLLTLVFSIERSMRMPHGITDEYLQERTQIAAHLPFWNGQIPRPAIVGAPHGDDFLATYMLDVHAFPSPNRTESTRDLYWILRSVPCRLIEARAVLAADIQECTVFLSDNSALTAFREMTAEERSRVLNHNKHYYDAFHRE